MLSVLQLQQNLLKLEVLRTFSNRMSSLLSVLQEQQIFLYLEVLRTFSHSFLRVSLAHRTDFSHTNSVEWKWALVLEWCTKCALSRTLFDAKGCPGQLNPANLTYDFAQLGTGHSALIKEKTKERKIMLNSYKSCH